MADPLQVSLKVAASGLDAQSTRMRVIAENLANLADAQAAVAAGFRNISGPGADVFMAARASAAARGGAEQPAAPAGRQ